MKRIGSSASFFVVALIMPTIAAAHHSFFGRFDRQSTMEIEGELVEVSWRNPHAYFVLQTTGESNSVWEVEASSASLMSRLGIEPDMFVVGQRIRFAGYPPVGEEHEIYARHALLADGRELLLDTRIEPRWRNRAVGEVSELSQTQGDGSRPELGIFRVWTLIRSGPRLFPEVVDPSFDITSYPMTPAARSALAAFDRVADNPTRNCAPKGMPTIMEQPYPIEFVAQDTGDIALHIEEYDLVRTIHMDGASSAEESSEASLLGHSTGEWDGAALLVRTDRISWPYFDQLGIPQSPQSKILERFTPTADGSRLDYELTVTDPVNFTAPVVLRNYWIWLPQARRLPYECTTR